MPSDRETPELSTQREAILRVSEFFGGVTLVRQSAVLAGCNGQHAPSEKARVMDA